MEPTKFKVSEYINIQHTGWLITAKCSLFFFPNTILFEFMGEKKTKLGIFIHNKLLTLLRYKKEKRIDDKEAGIIFLVQ